MIVAIFVISHYFGGRYRHVEQFLRWLIQTKILSALCKATATFTYTITSFGGRQTIFCGYGKSAVGLFAKCYTFFSLFHKSDNVYDIILKIFVTYVCKLSGIYIRKLVDTCICKKQKLFGIGREQQKHYRFFALLCRKICTTYVKNRYKKTIKERLLWQKQF